MAKFFGFSAALAAAAFGAVVTTSSATATADDTCVLVDFETATSDLTSLNNIVTIVKSSPSILSSYVSDPLILENQALSEVDFSLLGIDFTLTPTIETMNVTGITTISPKQINVTSSNTIDLGTDFTGEVSVAATLSVEIAQLNHEWYQVCWTDILNPSSCASTTFTVDVALALEQPELVTNVEVDMYQCAEGVSTSVCSNLTVTSILVTAISGGDLSSIGEAVLLRMKDAALNSLTLGWDSITNIDFNFNSSSAFISKLTNALLDFSAETLNKKGEIYDTFIEVLQKLLLSLLNNLIDEDLEPLFGATCLE